MTSAEISGGLVLPYFAITIAGKGGAAAILLITFMAVTSTLSAQVIAVSSIISFDMVVHLLPYLVLELKANSAAVSHILE
jgi:Na+/proline symporter